VVEGAGEKSRALPVRAASVFCDSEIPRDMRWWNPTFAQRTREDGAPGSVVVFWPTTMSAIASFIKLPKSALEGLRNSATSGTHHDYLSANGREIAEYRWSGYVMVTLLPYLEEKHQIDLMKSEYDDLAAFLTNTTSATHFIFTPSQRTAFLNRLEPKLFSEKEMRQYFNEFNATNEHEIGRAMLDGVRALHGSLGQIEDSSVVIFAIS
jgi:hypothetical protein